MQKKTILKLLLIGIFNQIHTEQQFNCSEECSNKNAINCLLCQASNCEQQCSSSNDLQCKEKCQKFCCTNFIKIKNLTSTVTLKNIYFYTKNGEGYMEVSIAPGKQEIIHLVPIFAKYPYNKTIDLNEATKFSVDGEGKECEYKYYATEMSQATYPKDCNGSDFVNIKPSSVYEVYIRKTNIEKENSSGMALVVKPGAGE